MKLTFTSEEVKDILVENLKNQGFNMRDRESSIDFKSRFLGKGQGSINSVELTIGAPVYDEPATEEPEIMEPSAIFEGD